MDNQEIQTAVRLAVAEVFEKHDPDKLGYTVESAAKALDVEKHVIRDAISRGELSARKRGRYWFIRKDYLMRWLAARE